MRASFGARANITFTLLHVFQEMFLKVSGRYSKTAFEGTAKNFSAFEPDRIRYTTDAEAL